MPRSAKITFAIITLSWFLLSSNQKNWSRDQIKADVVSYYSYLPALFIDHDLSLSFLNHPEGHANGRYWAGKAPNGAYVIKTSMGLSLVYLPSFLIAHYVVAPLGGYVRNGYTEAYQACLAGGSFVFLFLGLYYLRKTLLQFYSETIALWTIVSVYFGTNLLWYSYGEALMPHEFMFAFISFLLYLTIRWHQQPTLKTSMLLGIVCGIIIIVRPVDVLFCSIPLLYGSWNKQYLQTKLNLILQNWGKVLMMVSIVFLMQLPQLFYWKTLTGNWFYNSYPGERFFWNHPHLLQGLFGFRKGWLLYTPIMLFAVVGLFYMKNKEKDFLLSIAILLPVFCFILFCWWSWWYGGTFGMRPMIDIYALLAIPMAASFETWMKIRWSKIATTICICFFIALNLFQTYQYNNFIIHFDSMTAQAYWHVFGRYEKPDHWWETLRLTDPLRAQRGLPEEYTLQEIFEGSYFLRTHDNKVISCDAFGNLSQIENYDYTVPEHFSFIPASNNSAIIKATNGCYITVNDSNHLEAKAQEAEQATAFEIKLLGDNKLELHAGGFCKLIRLYMSN